MLPVKLDGRLSAIAALIGEDKSRIVLDIGTDHGLLPCYLKQRGQRHVIASDIGEKPLSAAKNTMDFYGIRDIELVLTDGLSGIEYADDVVIAGMGGETIAEIIAGCDFLNTDLRFILQPMTRHAELRRALYRMGFEILTETAARADGRIYTVILSRYVGVPKEIDDLFAFIGLQTDADYLEIQLSRVRKMLCGKPEYSELITKMEAILNDGANGQTDI